VHDVYLSWASEDCQSGSDLANSKVRQAQRLPYN